jgi:hypothetical protein
MVNQHNLESIANFLRIKMKRRYVVLNIWIILDDEKSMHAIALANKNALRMFL